MDQLFMDFNVVKKDIVLSGNLQNIKNMLPTLYDHQQEDVMRAEIRFQKGKGYLFTNGTGTGKTYVGLGIAKRFFEQGKKNILIVVPTDTKALDWIQDGRNVSLFIHKIKDVNDKGTDVCVTTYANFYQNEKINDRTFDLIIYDESHYLMQNGNGDQTVYLRRHKTIANLPSTVKYIAEDLAGYRPDRDDDDYNDKIGGWNERRIFIAKELVDKTKVVFLSATPFAYHKSIEYADGCLFDINETLEEKDKSAGYNQATGFGSFLQEHFGYRMRHNKVTVPETGVDQNLLERNFFEKNFEKGIMSTRVLDLDFDYSRDFITVKSGIGEHINKGMEMFYSLYMREKYKYLSIFAPRKYNYLFVNQLLECIKAQEVHVRIQQHIDLGRKVVVFHSYNNATIKHPFEFNAEELTRVDEKSFLYELEREIYMFNQEFPEYVDLDLSGFKNTRKAIIDHFPQAKEFNGTVSKKKRKLNILDFNTDYSPTDVLIVQTKAGREGISLHDKEGGQQRVLITLGLPVAPTEAIQTEGRIYRAGLKSNAIYEYITVQTNFEMIAFATKIAERSKTAENLAMGNLARDLETAFKEGYIGSEFMEPNLDQGVGGKLKDRMIQTISEFDKAKTFYWSRAKKNSKTKSSEGIDYYATPEPFGLKILEWIDPQPDERGLEPSSGHGAIARWFPKNTINKFIEPSYTLSAELEINTNGEVINERFEDFYFGNKFEFIAMNPPFGVGGSVAITHIKKAVSQMYIYSKSPSRLFAIVPQGNSMNKRLEAFYLSDDFRMFRLTGEILLPSCMFERAGTKVFCKLIRIERHTKKNEYTFNQIDLTRCKDINEFFDEIEELEF
jgi:hypothetical protein